MWNAINEMIAGQAGDWTHDCANGQTGGCLCARIFVYETIPPWQTFTAHYSYTSIYAHMQSVYVIQFFGQPLNENLQPNEPLTVIASKMGILFCFLLARPPINIPNKTQCPTKACKKECVPMKWERRKRARQSKRASGSKMCIEWCATEMRIHHQISSDSVISRCVSVTVAHVHALSWFGKFFVTSAIIATCPNYKDTLHSRLIEAIINTNRVLQIICIAINYDEIYCSEPICVSRLSHSQHFVLFKSQFHTYRFQKFLSSSFVIARYMSCLVKNKRNNNGKRNNVAFLRKKEAWKMKRLNTKVEMIVYRVSKTDKKNQRRIADEHFNWFASSSVYCVCRTLFQSFP